jgi:hypothetical protein
MPKRHRILLASIAVAAVATTSLAVPAVTSASPATHTARAATTSSQRGTLVTHVRGTFGKNGTVRGTFAPERSFVKGGQTYVQGDLAVTMRRANGKLVGRTTRHNVNLPIDARGAHRAGAATAAAAATCSILHLNLGPLNLNLLGLHVHLKRVVLNITAQSGSGNLLGNLLCAVAHLLDGTSPSLTDLLKLGNLLNRIIGLLT